jgi:RNA-binding protein
MSNIPNKKDIMRRSLNAMIINVGKSGVNDNVIEEIKRQLKNGEIVKLRFSRSIASGKDELVEEIVAGTKSHLIDVRGNVAVLYKRKR